MNYSQQDALAKDELMHHGVIGMKWGVRRYQNKDGTRTPRGKRQRSEDHTRSRELKKKRLDEMSNKEINELLNRQRLEMQYKQLNPSMSQRGAKWLQSFLKEFGSDVLKDVLKSEIKKGAKKAVRKAVIGV